MLVQSPPVLLQTPPVLVQSLPVLVQSPPDLSLMDSQMSKVLSFDTSQDNTEDDNIASSIARLKRMREQDEDFEPISQPMSQDRAEDDKLTANQRSNVIARMKIIRADMAAAATTVSLKM